MTSNSESLPLIDYDEQAVSFHKRTETMSTLELISESNLQQCVFLLGNLLNQESAEFMSYTSVENEPCENYSNGGSLKRQRRPTSTQCSNSNHKRRKNLHLTSLDFNSLLVEPNVSDIKVKTGEISDHFIHENDSEGISDKSSNTIEDSDCEKTRILQVDGASDDVEQSILHQNVGSSSKEVGQIAMVGSRMPVADGIQFYEHLESRPSRFLNFDGSSRMLMAPVMGSDSQSPSLSYFGGTSGSPSPQSFQFNPRLSSFANSNHKQQMTQFDPFPFPVNAVLSPSQPPSEYLQSSHYSSFNSPYGFPLGKNWLQMKQHEQERLPPRKKGHFPWRQSPPKADHRQQDGVCQRFPNFHAFEQNYVGANSSYIPQANRFNNSYLPQAFSSNIPRHGSPYLDPSPFSISAQLPDKHRQSSPRCMDSQDMGEIFLDQKLHKIRQNRSLSHHDRESNLYNSKSSESFTCNFDVNVSSHPHSSSQSSVIGKPKIASPLKSPMGSIATSNTSEDFLRNQNSNTSCSPGWLSQSLRLPAYNSIPSSSIPNGSLQSSFVQQWPPTMATSSCSNSRDENQQNSAQLAGHQKQHRLIREKSKPVEDFDNYVEQKQNDASLGGGTTKLCHLSVENEMLDRNNVENKKHTGKPTLSEIAQKNDTDTLNSKIERLSSCSSEMATSIGSVSRFHPLDGIQSYPSSDGIYEDRMRNPFQFLKSDESRNANEYVRNSNFLKFSSPKMSSDFHLANLVSHVNSVGCVDQNIATSKSSYNFIQANNNASIADPQTRPLVVKSNAPGFQNEPILSPPSIASHRPPNQVENDSKMNSSMYEAWLVQHEGWLLEKIGGLETIVAQQKRIKKTLTTKQKMAKKLGQDLPDSDICRLMETKDEQTRTQQSLYQLRKDLTRHQSIVNDHKMKKEMENSFIGDSIIQRFPHRDDKNLAHESTSKRNMMGPLTVNVSSRQFENRVQLQDKRLFDNRVQLQNQRQFDNQVLLQDERQNDSQAQLQDKRRFNNQAHLRDERLFNNQAQFQNDRRFDNRAQFRDEHGFDNRAQLQNERLFDDRVQLQDDRQFDDRAKFLDECRFDDQVQLQNERQFDNRVQLQDDRQFDNRVQLQDDRQFDNRVQLQNERQLDDRVQLQDDRQFDNRVQLQNERQFDDLTQIRDERPFVNRAELREEGLFDNQIQLENDRQFDNRVQLSDERQFDNQVQLPDERLYESRVLIQDDDQHRGSLKLKISLSKRNKLQPDNLPMSQNEPPHSFTSVSSQSAAVSCGLKIRQLDNQNSDVNQSQAVNDTKSSSLNSVHCETKRPTHSLSSPVHSQATHPLSSPVHSRSAHSLSSPIHSRAIHPLSSPVHSRSAHSLSSPIHSQATHSLSSPVHSRSTHSLSSPIHSQASHPLSSPVHSRSAHSLSSPIHSRAIHPLSSPVHSRSAHSLSSPAHSRANHSLSPAHSRVTDDVHACERYSNMMVVSPISSVTSSSSNRQMPDSSQFLETANMEQFPEVFNKEVSLTKNPSLLTKANHSVDFLMLNEKKMSDQDYIKPVIKKCIRSPSTSDVPANSGKSVKQELQKYIKNGQLKLKEKLVKKRMRKLKISATNEFTTDAHSLLPEMQRPNPELALQQLLKLLKSLPQLTLILPIYSVEDEFIKTCTSEFTGSAPSCYGSLKLNAEPDYYFNLTSRADEKCLQHSETDKPVNSPDICPNVEDKAGCSQDNRLSVTVTLSRTSSHDIASVLAAIASMLKTAIPDSFQVRQKLAIDERKCSASSGLRNHRYVANEERITVPMIIKNRPKFCHHCSTIVDSTLLQNGQLLGTNEDDDAIFCSIHCQLDFARVKDFPETKSELTDSATKFEDVTDNEDNNEHNKTLIYDTGQFDVQMDITPPKSKLEVVQRAKWKGIRYDRWKTNFMKSINKLKPTRKDSKKQKLQKNFVGIETKKKLTDTRCCAFCHIVGDGEADCVGRLLNMDLDLWVHTNCALWSYEVYETMDGSFVNVGQAYERSLVQDCTKCGKKGATIGCFDPNCPDLYHLGCAKSNGFHFLENKTTFCNKPKSRLPLNHMLEDLKVIRRVFIDRDENLQMAKMLGLDDHDDFLVRIGSLVVHNIGQLLPHQAQSGNFHTADNIYPVGFKSTRYYWSYRQLHRRCYYVCSIEDHRGKPMFRIVVKEHGFPEEVIENTDCTGAWLQVLLPLEELRKIADLTSLYSKYLNGEDLFGLNEPAVRRAIESLPGVELIHNCKLRYGKSSIYVLPLAINPSGCIRSEPKSRTFFKRSHTLLSSFKAGSSSNSAWLGSGEFSIHQYMKQFTATKSQRYRSLKTEWRNNVYLRRSNVQGLGLFAARELEQFTMVIEYIGQLIRNEVSEIREKVYEQQNRGVYMFRVNENTVIDATMAGGPARYINHSCNPNCFTEIVATERGDKIVITAKRKIQSGEELTYDYMFDLEDEKSRIPCLCGSENCRKWMN